MWYTIRTDKLTWNLSLAISNACHSPNCTHEQIKYFGRFNCAVAFVGVQYKISLDRFNAEKYKKVKTNQRIQAGSVYPQWICGLL